MASVILYLFIHLLPGVLSIAPSLSSCSCYCLLHQLQTPLEVWLQVQSFYHVIYYTKLGFGTSCHNYSKMESPSWSWLSISSFLVHSLAQLFTPSFPSFPVLLGARPSAYPFPILFCFRTSDNAL